LSRDCILVFILISGAFGKVPAIMWDAPLYWWGEAPEKPGDFTKGSSTDANR